MITWIIHNWDNDFMGFMVIATEGKLSILSGGFYRLLWDPPGGLGVIHNCGLLASSGAV